MNDSSSSLVAQDAAEASKNHWDRLSPLGRLLSRSKWIQLLEIVIVFSPVLLVIIAHRITGFDNPLAQIGAVWVANLVMLGLIWLGIRLRRETWNSIGLGFQKVGISEIGGAILKSIPILGFAMAGFVIGSIVGANLVGIPEGADMTKYNYLQDNLPMLLISLAGVYIVSSFGEEVVYRGFLITRLQDLFGSSTKSIMTCVLSLSAIIFGLAHFEWGAMGIMQTTGMGAALSVSFLLNHRRLWPLVLAHAWMDTILLMTLYFSPAAGSGA